MFWYQEKKKGGNFCVIVFVFKSFIFRIFCNKPRPRLVRGSIGGAKMTSAPLAPTRGNYERALFSIIQSEMSKQHDGWSLAHETPVADSGRFKSCISWKLFGAQHLDFGRIFDWMLGEEAPTFQFISCLFCWLGYFNFTVKIGLAPERSKMSFPPFTPSITYSNSEL